MSEKDPIGERKPRSRLTLNEEDLNAGTDVNSVSLIEGLSYQKLFTTIVLAAPVAAVLAMFAVDVYSVVARKIGLRPENQIVIQQSKEAASEAELLRTAVQAVALSNREITAALEKQTAVLAKLSIREPAQPKEAAPVKVQKTEPAAKETKKEKPAQTDNEKPSVNDAKKKVQNLSGVDVGKAVKSKAFDSIKSKETLKEIESALDVIIAGSKSGDTIKKNAEKAKKLVAARLAALEKKQR